VGGDRVKIAVVTDDGKTISQHFGRALYYAVYEVRSAKVEGMEIKLKVVHHREGEEQLHGHQEASKHSTMLYSVQDCEALIARGMGRGAYEAIKQSGIKPIITDKIDADEAVEAYVKGTLEDHPERLH
jgi:predicted Fe-Mo cluster-binding NifX family protein